MAKPTCIIPSPFYFLISLDSLFLTPFISYTLINEIPYNNRDAAHRKNGLYVSFRVKGEGMEKIINARDDFKRQYTNGVGEKKNIFYSISSIIHVVSYMSKIINRIASYLLRGERPSSKLVSRTFLKFEVRDTEDFRVICPGFCISIGISIS